MIYIFQNYFYTFILLLFDLSFYATFCKLFSDFKCGINTFHLQFHKNHMGNVFSKLLMNILEAPSLWKFDSQVNLPYEHIHHKLMILSSNPIVLIKIITISHKKIPDRRNWNHGVMDVKTLRTCKRKKMYLTIYLFFF